MTYFDQIDPINDIFTTFLSINLTEIIVRKLGKKLFDQIPKILTYVAILAPKICQNYPILNIFT